MVKLYNQSNVHHFSSQPAGPGENDGVPAATGSKGFQVFRSLGLVMLLACSFFLGGNDAKAQLLFTEDFNYPASTTLSPTNFYAVVSAGANAQTVAAAGTGLSYATSPRSALGRAVTLATSGEDVSTPVFTATTTPGAGTNSVYTSALISLSASQVTGDYFLAIGTATTIGRFYARTNGVGYSFGILKATGTVAYEATVRTFGTTYLIVYRYDMVFGTNNDLVSLYVNPVLGAGEPAATIAATTAGSTSDAGTTIDRVTIRQGAAANAPTPTIDGIMVGRTWANVTSLATLTNSGNVTGLTYGLGAGPSTPASAVTISASTLTGGGGNLTIRSSANFDVSITDAVSGFVTGGATVTLPYTGTGALANNTVWVRLKAGLPIATYPAESILISGGAGSVTFTASGSVTSIVPTINPSGNLTGITYNEGNANPTGMPFTISALNLTPAAGNIDFTSSANYEVSATSATTGFVTTGNTVSLPYTAGGSLAANTIWVRLKPGLSLGVVGTETINIAGGTATSSITVAGLVTAAFLPGNLVVMRYLGSVAATGAAIGLDEFSTLGVKRQTQLAPTVVNGAHKRIVASTTATSEGALGISPDKRFLTFVGYDANPGTPSIATTNSATVNRVIGFVNYNGDFNTTTSTTAFNAAGIRSGFTIDGQNFWATGASGIEYEALGGSSSTNISTINSRNINATTSQLYSSSAAAGNIGINKIGTGFPSSIVLNTNYTLLTGLTPTDANGYVLLDDQPGIPGVDLVYVANNTSIQKYSFDGTVWTARGSLTAAAAYNIAAIKNGLNYDLYITIGAASANTIYKLTDVAAYNVNITGNGTALTTTGTLWATAPAGTTFRGIQPTPENVLTPDVAISSSNPGGASIAQSVVDEPIYRIDLAVTTATALLTGVDITTTGTYLATDIVNFKLRYSTDATLDGADALLNTISTSIAAGSGELLNFGAFGQTLPFPATGYLFVTADMAGCVSTGRTIGVLAPSLLGVKFAIANKTGSMSAGTVYNIVAGLPPNVTGLTVPSLVPTINVSWTNPPCFTNFIVVVSTSSTIADPLLPSYSFNTNYGLAPAYPGGGKVVYSGTVSPQTITNLPLGVTYYIKVFTRDAGAWSVGSQTSAFINTTTLFSVDNGSANTDPIWALTPAGTGVTVASLGGFSATKNITIQTGYQVDFPTTISCLDFTVKSGGQAWANSGSERYINVSGNISNSGIIGNGTTLDGLGFSVEGTTCTFSGAGTTNVGRIRKSLSTAVTSSLIINSNINVRWPGVAPEDAAIYNNVNGTTFNMTINSGRTVTLTSATGNFAIDGTDGASVGERGGNVTVNGTLAVGGRIIGKQNNVSTACTFTIGSTGRVVTKDIDIDPTAGFGGFLLTINAGGKVEVSGTLNVLGGTVNSNGGIILKSNATTTGRIGNSAGSISGNITSERYIPTLGWHFIGTALAGQIISDWNDDFNTQGPMPGVQTPNPGSNTSSIFQYNEANVLNDGLGQVNGWEVPTSSALTQNVGYRVYTPGIAILDNTGTYSTGTKNLALNFTGGAYAGYNLIMNPHLSPIDWTSGSITKTNMAAGALIYNPVSAQYEYIGSAIGGIPTNAGNNIASGQAFMVRATSGGATVSIPEASKVATATFHRTVVDENNRIRISFKAAGSPATDEALFKFMDGTTAEYDPEFDAEKFENAGMNVYTVTPEYKQMAINGLPFMGVQMVIPVGVKAASGNYSFTISGMENLLISSNVYFRDFETGALVNLATNPVYNFTLSEVGTVNNRFELIFTPFTVTEIKANLELNNAMRIFPNPTSDAAFNVVVDKEQKGNAELWIENIAGQRISTQTLTLGLSKSNSFSVAKPVSAGIYVVKMRVNGKVLNQKLVVQ